MVTLTELVDYTNKLLSINTFRDYCPNGLQVEGKSSVEHIVCGVTACQELVDAAIDAKADAIVVHHGYFWKGENLCITGIKKNRLQALLQHNINLLAYHLPLDAHLELGNNAELARILGLTVTGIFGPSENHQYGLYGELATALSSQQLIAQLREKLGRDAQHIPGRAQQIKKVAWCTGAAQSYIEAAADLGVDAFISGEISEQTVHIARETGTHYFGAGHHATERYGVQALGNHLATKFALNYQFIDIDNPV